jgi:mannose-6-phosphate isomerase-like protein (cupin superfamily)
MPTRPGLHGPSLWLRPLLWWGGILRCHVCSRRLGISAYESDHLDPFRGVILKRLGFCRGKQNPLQIPIGLLFLNEKSQVRDFFFFDKKSARFGNFPNPFDNKGFLAHAKIGLMKPVKNGSSYLSEADLSYALYLKKDPRLADQPQFHESHEFVFVLDGKIKAFVGDQVEELTPGMISHAPSYIRHYYSQESETILCYVLVLALEYTKSFRQEYPGKDLPFFMKDVAKNKAIYAIMDQWISFSERDHLLNYGFSDLVFSLLAKSYTLINTPREDADDLSLKLLRYVDQHYLEDISLKSVSEELGYSMEYCSKALGKVTRMNFRSYLNFLRFRKADELLEGKAERDEQERHHFLLRFLFFGHLLPQQKEVRRRK